LFHELLHDIQSGVAMSKRFGTSSDYGVQCTAHASLRVGIEIRGNGPRTSVYRDGPVAAHDAAPLRP
jgi:hypothetical protein